MRPGSNIAPTPHDSFGVPDLSVTLETLIGMASIIGGFLGAALGALESSAKAPAVANLRPCASPFDLLPPLSLRQITGTFLVVGPLLYMPLFLVLSLYPSGPGTNALDRPFGPVFSLPLVAPVGAVLWYATLSMPATSYQTAACRQQL